MSNFLSQLLGFDFVNDKSVHVFIEQLARVANIDRSLYFIARQNPNLNSSPFQIVNSLPNIILKFVLNSSRSYEFKVDFQLFGDFSKQLFFIN